ncbi:MAG: DUF998 domain-containing protein [Acholeplasma sp.]|jgi:hypothetical protein|nr:MAG: DUF998 domain-containing protein [Acholeplasma sp.]
MMKRWLSFQYVREIVMVIAVMAVISYVLHVFLGTLAYPGYDALSQPVSDLTASGAPSESVARLYSNLYGILTSVVSLILLFQLKKVKHIGIRIGILLISIMYLVSAIGYGLFPLDENSSQMSFQNMMHIVVTIAVVLLTITSLIVFMIAFIKLKYRGFFLVTCLTFILMMSGAILTGVVNEAYLGLFERFSVFSAVLFHLMVPYLFLKHHEI